MKKIFVIFSLFTYVAVYAGTENGHEWVDLGLPSGLKWATMNIGASVNSDFGSWFAWGETTTKYSYTSDNYTYTDSPTTLPLTADVAHAKWKGGWRMPTKKEMQELIDNCNWKYQTQDGNKGYLVTSKTNGNSIFIPWANVQSCVGFSCDCRGYYWSSTVKDANEAWLLYLNVFSGYGTTIYIKRMETANRYGGFHTTAYGSTTCILGYSVRAVCESISYTLTVKSNNTSFGIVSGGGTYTKGTSVTMKATAKTGYRFVRWDDNNTSVSRTITVSADVTYTAYFEADTVSTTEKVLPGLFSVNDSMKVRFSSGNLQYCATPGTHQCADGTAQKGIWRFAAHQYDFIGTLNSNISSTYASWIDLFGWGTSGWSNGATCYQPWSTSQTNTDYLTPGLVGTPSYADWGVYNAIANGGNKTNLWRTLTGAEMDYILNVRENADSLRTSACINNTYGLLLLPDDFVKPNGITINLSVIACTENTYSTSQFDALENSGAVFIPYAGYREGTIISHDSGDYMGDYWMADSYSDKKAHRLIIRNARATAGESNEQKMYGFSVRLVKPLYHIHVLPNDNVKGSTIGSGEYDNKSTITISATPNDCYQFLKWSDGNTDNPRSITVTQDSTFTAIFEKIQFNLSVDVSDSEHGEVTTSAVED